MRTCQAQFQSWKRRLRHKKKAGRLTAASGSSDRLNFLELPLNKREKKPEFQVRFGRVAHVFEAAEALRSWRRLCAGH